MADKGTQEAIKKKVDARPRALLDIMDAEMVTQQNFEGTQGALVLGLRFLVEDFREQANLVMESGARGKGAEATALRSTASALSLLADGVEKVDLDHGAPAPVRTREQVVADAGLDEPVHGFRPFDSSGKCGERVTRGTLSEMCGRYLSHPAHRSTSSLGSGTPDGLKALVTERAASQQPTPSDESEAMRAYLRGDTDTMPEFTGFADPRTLDDSADGDGQGPSMPVLPNPLAGAEWPEHVTQRGPVTDPQILKAAKVLEPVPVVFAEPSPAVRTGDPVMPGRRLTFAELRAPAPVAPVPHTSNSQVTQMNDCGLQARLSRYEPGVIERPQWHLVGGKALHRVAEEFERMVLAQDPEHIYVRVSAKELWKAAFNTEIIAQVMACPQVPQDDWRASGRGGSEGYTWWLTSGVDMVQRYLDMRLVNLDRAILWRDETPVLELEGVLDVEGTPHKVVIDQAWRWGANDIVIDDLKSGANAPRGGTFQLAQYGWYLHKELGYGYEGSRIYGRYWDARKGTYSAPVDLLELHPWDEIVWRIKDAQAKKDAGLFGPNPGPFCGGCPVKRACPVVSRG